jgi:hypothetical protein
MILAAAFLPSGRGALAAALVELREAPEGRAVPVPRAVEEAAALDGLQLNWSSQ